MSTNEEAPISGARISEVRKQTRPLVTQMRLARAIGLSQAWMSNLEQDVLPEPIKEGVAQVLADYLGVVGIDVFREPVGTPVRWREDDAASARAITGIDRLVSYLQRLGPADQAFVMDEATRTAEHLAERLGP